MIDTIILVMVLANVLNNTATPALDSYAKLCGALKRCVPEAREVAFQIAVLILMFALPTYVVKLIYSSNGLWRPELFWL